MKKAVLLFTCILFALVSCKKTETGQKPQVEKKIEQKSEKKVDAKTAPVVEKVELTDESFNKGRSLSNLTIMSLKTKKPVSIASLKGKKVLIDFWSSWCEPCIEMFPDLNKLKAEYQDKKGVLEVLTISVDPMPGKIIQIIKEKNAQFDVLQAPESLRNAGILLPTTVIIDEKGTVMARTNGKHSYDELVKFAGLQ